LPGGCVNLLENLWPASPRGVRQPELQAILTACHMVRHCQAMAPQQLYLHTIRKGMACGLLQEILESKTSGRSGRLCRWEEGRSDKGPRGKVHYGSKAEQTQAPVTDAKRSYGGIWKKPIVLPHTWSERLRSTLSVPLIQLQF